MIERPQIVPLKSYAATRACTVVISATGRTFDLAAGRRALLDGTLNAELIRNGSLVEHHEAGRRQYPEGHPGSSGWSL